MQSRTALFRIGNTRLSPRTRTEVSTASSGQSNLQLWLKIASLEGSNLATLIRMKLPVSSTTNEPRKSPISVNPDLWVDRHGDCLYRYALLRVRRPEVAEELVQETLFAAVRTYSNFRGKSSERSWLCGILKNKICDYFREACSRGLVYRSRISRRRNVSQIH